MIFFRYVLRNFLFYCSLSLVFCVFLFVLFDFIDKSKYYFPVVNSDFKSILLYYLCQIPYLVVQSAPLATLFASAIVMYQLSVSGEMTAMQSFGYEPRKLLGPMAASAFLMVFFFFLTSEWLAPYFSTKAHYISKVIFEGKKHSFLNKTKWSRDRGSFYSYGSFDPDSRIFYQLKVVKLDQEFQVTEIKKVRKALFLEDISRWKFVDGETLYFERGETFSVSSVKFKEKLSTLPISPDLMKIERRFIRELSLYELSRIMNRNKKNGMDLLEVNLAFHSKLAHLVVAFLFSFAGFPLAFLAQRRRETLGHLLSMVFLGFGYWLLFSLLRAILLSGALSVPAGVWGANAVLSFYIALRIKKST